VVAHEPFEVNRVLVVQREGEQDEEQQSAPQPVQGSHGSSVKVKKMG